MPGGVNLEKKPFPDVVLPACPWPEDQVIRDAGFSIAVRTGNKVLWKRGDREYTHDEAFVIAAREQPQVMARKRAEAENKKKVRNPARDD